MEDSAPEITEDQEQQLMATKLQDGTTALDYVLSWPEADQPWALAGVISCIKEGLQPEPPHDQLGGAGSAIRQ